jgi:hypothetical protein
MELPGIAEALVPRISLKTSEDALHRGGKLERLRGQRRSGSVEEGGPRRNWLRTTRTARRPPAPLLQRTLGLQQQESKGGHLASQSSGATVRLIFDPARRLDRPV